MIVQIYKISIWENSERISEIECKVYTDDVNQSIKDLKQMDFGFNVTKNTRFNLRYIERDDMVTMPEMKIGYINRAKLNERWLEEKSVETKRK